MKKRTILCVMAVLCLGTTLNAQFYKPTASTLHMGDKLPDSIFLKEFNTLKLATGARQTINLKAYQNKLIIVDFWATSSSPCISALQKLGAQQPKLIKDEVLILPVTYQQGKQPAAFVKAQSLNLTSIVADTLLAKTFPHSGIRYQVWVKNGKILAFPWWTYATAENIKKIIAGATVAFSENRADYIVDPLRTILTKTNAYAVPYFKNTDVQIARYVKAHRIEKPRWYIPPIILFCTPSTTPCPTYDTAPLKNRFFHC